MREAIQIGVTIYLVFGYTYAMLTVGWILGAVCTNDKLRPPHSPLRTFTVDVLVDTVSWPYQIYRQLKGKR